MERIESLGIKNYKIYQDDSLYCFTSDAVLLSKFATVKQNDVVADFCAGSGIVGFHLYALSEKVKSVTFFEMQKSLFDLSNKSILLNNLSDKFNAVNVKVQEIDKSYYGKFSLIVCNPPYMEVGKGFKDLKEEIAVCRTEISLSLSELILSASKCLKYGGRFALCHRADRTAEIIERLKENGIEPKKIQFVSAKGKEPYLILIEGVKGGKPGVKVYKEIEN